MYRDIASGEIGVDGRTDGRTTRMHNARRPSTIVEGGIKCTNRTTGLRTVALTVAINYKLAGTTLLL